MTYKLLNISKVFFMLAAMLLLSSCIFNPVDSVGTCTPISEAFTTVDCKPGDCPKKYLTVPEEGVAKEKQKGIMTWVVSKMEGILGDASQGMFRIISTDESFLGILKASMTLVVMFYGAAVALAIVDARAFSVFLVAVKLLLVYYLITDWGDADTGREPLFKELVINNFEALVRDLSNFMSNTFSGQRVFSDDVGASGYATIEDGAGTFSVIDGTVSMFFNWNFMKIILALFFTGWTGFIYAVVLILVILAYLFAVISAIKTYIVALIARTLLYAVAPIFLVFALFSQTRSIFDGWLEQVINFSLQPIFLFAFLGLFNLVIIGFLDSVVSIDTQVVCYGPIEYLAGWIPFLHWYHFGDDTPGKPLVSGMMNYGAEVPFNFWAIIALAILTYLMKNMADWVVEIAGRISSGFVSAAGVKVAGEQQLKDRRDQIYSGSVGGIRGAFLGAKDKTGQRQGGLLRRGAGGGPSPAFPGGAGEKKGARERVGGGIRSAFSRMREGAGAGWKSGVKRAGEKGGGETKQRSQGSNDQESNI